MALSSLSLLMGFGLFRLDGLGGGLLVGVEVLIGEGWSSSALLEGKESSAKMPNLLLSLNLIQASALSSESMVLPDPEIIKLFLLLPVLDDCACPSRGPCLWLELGTGVKRASRAVELAEVNLCWLGRSVTSSLVAPLDWIEWRLANSTPSAVDGAVQIPLKASFSLA